MKPNNYHVWQITLFGGPSCNWNPETFTYIGTVESALARADERETEAEFEVVQILLTRGKRVSRKDARR